MASSLSQYFLSTEYVQGHEFPFQKNGYSHVEANVYEHEVSKMHVWSLALDVRRVKEGGRGVVVYHYTSKMFFNLITHPSKENIELFASKNRDADSNHGLGLYATSKAPDQWSCQDEALINNFWPRPHTWEKWREKQGLQSAARPEKASAKELLETELLRYVQTVEDPQLLRGKAAYCIPVLSDASDAINVMEEETLADQLPDGSKTRQPGHNRFGEEEPPWRDVYVIALWGRDGEVRNLVQGSDATIELMRRRLEVKREALGAQHRETLVCVDKLATVLHARGKWEEAEDLYREALKGSKETLGVQHPETLSSTNNLAAVLEDRGKWEEAEDLHREVLKCRRGTLGAQEPEMLCSINNLATVLKARGKWEEAEGLLQEALKGRRETMGAQHPDTLSSINNLAGVLKARGKLEEAEDLNREALNCQRDTMGAQHPDTLTSINNLASVLHAQGKVEEVEDLHREALKGRRETIGAQHPDTLTSINNLAMVKQKICSERF